MADYSAELREAQCLLSQLVAHTKAFDTARLSFVPAVIDKSTTHTVLWKSEDTTGICRFIDSLEHHLANLDQMAQSSAPPRDDPLQTVLGLATSWKCIVLAEGPVPAVRMAAKVEEPWDKSKKRQPKAKQPEAFVDVVARGGIEWIRIYGKKTSKLMAEFREADSYVNSDYESEDEGAEIPHPRLKNSIIKLVDELTAMAQAVERIPGAPVPSLTLRVTRIEEHPEGGHPDPRIDQTFEEVRKRGVNLIFGDLSETPISVLPTAADPPRPVVPTRRLNLDPTALMGLCSDLLHYPLPTSAAGAKERFYRPEEVVGPKGQSQNSRELVRALMEEMEEPLIEEIRDALTAVGGDVELWVTRQAVTYLQETISSEDVIGEGEEQRRMRRLTGLEEGDFWEGSRYQGKSGVLSNIKLHVFDEPDTYPDYLKELVLKEKPANGHQSTGGTAPSGEPLLPPIHTTLNTPLCADGMTSFHQSTFAICSTFLDEYTRHISNPTAESAAALPSFLNPRRLPSPRIARISIPFTVVSLHSLARGAAEGMSTLSMGHVVFRELFSQPRWRIKGWTQSNYQLEKQTSPVNAVAWILPYRSLGEAKRIKFAARDYSFPTFIKRGPQSASKDSVDATPAETPRQGSPAPELN